MLTGGTSCTTASDTVAVTTATASRGLGGELSTTWTSDTKIVQIFQFKAQYQLSDITSDIRDRMTTAVSNLLKVNAKNVSLSFVSVPLRIMQEFVIVSVGLVNFQGSLAGFSSMITQEGINAEMAAAGLKSVELLTSASALATTQGKVSAIMMNL